MKIRSRFVPAVWILCALALALAAPAFADSHGKPAKSGKTSEAVQPGPDARPEPSAEARAKMADAHQRMAECLRSDRPMKECRGEMKKAHASFGHGKQCTHGDSCPHDASCPHGDDCDGSCKHHGPHGEMHGDGHGKTSKSKDPGTQETSKDDASKKKKAE